ncbi:MAG: PHP domain-containing protein [Candidatus Cloacimonadota bacterium]|nr:MAG: PHP domain-containing protein [Candidatus Cloacimonadota bacterium]
MGLCDLHIHSRYSDGTYTPLEIVEKAKAKHLDALSITDHDTTKGVDPAKLYGKEMGIRVVSGVELSAIYQDIEIHVLGYLFDEHDKRLYTKLSQMREYREERARGILRKLENYGFTVNFDFVKKLAGEGTIGRPHIAQAMLESRKITNYKEAFVKYIGNGKPCNVLKYRLNPTEAIDLMREAGGIPVLAHPGNIRNDNFVLDLFNFPFLGIEVWHPDHTSRQIKDYLEIAEKRNLLVTGGSDSHGDIPTKALLGGMNVDISIVDSLIQYKETYL